MGIAVAPMEDRTLMPIPRRPPARGSEARVAATTSVHLGADVFRQSHRIHRPIPNPRAAVIMTDAKATQSMADYSFLKQTTLGSSLNSVH